MFSLLRLLLGLRSGGGKVMAGSRCSVSTFPPSPLPSRRLGASTNTSAGRLSCTLLRIILIHLRLLRDSRLLPELRKALRPLVQGSNDAESRKALMMLKVVFLNISANRHTDLTRFS